MRGSVGVRHGTSPFARSRTPTTPSCPRPSKPGASRCLQEPPSEAPPDHLRNQPADSSTRSSGKATPTIPERVVADVPRSQGSGDGRACSHGPSGHRREPLGQRCIRTSHAAFSPSACLHDFARTCTPTRFNNKTNGITPRRWLQKAELATGLPDHRCDR